MAGIQKGSSDNLTSPIPHLLNADFLTATARLAAGQIHYAGRDYYQRDTDTHYRLRSLSRCFAADGTTPATFPGTWGTLEAHWVVGATAGTNGTNGVNGNRVLALAGAPVLSDGNLADLAIVTTVGDLYEKTSSGWALRGNLKGPAGAGGTGTGTSAGVSTFNTRSGAVTLTAADVLGVVSNSNQLAGGLHNAPTRAAMDAIPAALRDFGMTVIVYLDPIAANNGRYDLATDLKTFIKQGVDLAGQFPPYNGATLYNATSAYVTYPDPVTLVLRIFHSLALTAPAQQPTPVSSTNVLNPAWEEISPSAAAATRAPQATNDMLGIVRGNGFAGAVGNVSVNVDGSMSVPPLYNTITSAVDGSVTPGAVNTALLQLQAPLAVIRPDGTTLYLNRWPNNNTEAPAGSQIRIRGNFGDLTTLYITPSYNSIFLEAGAVFTFDRLCPQTSDPLSSTSARVVIAGPGTLRGNIIFYNNPTISRLLIQGIRHEGQLINESNTVNALVADVKLTNVTCLPPAGSPYLYTLARNGASGGCLYFRYRFYQCRIEVSGNSGTTYTYINARANTVASAFMLSAFNYAANTAQDNSDQANCLLEVVGCSLYGDGTSGNAVLATYGGFATYRFASNMVYGITAPTNASDPAFTAFGIGSSSGSTYTAGTGIAISGTNVISAPGTPATATTAGVVKIGSGLNVDGTGLLSLTASAPLADVFLGSYDVTGNYPAVNATGLGIAKGSYYKVAYTFSTITKVLTSAGTGASLSVADSTGVMINTRVSGPGIPAGTYVTAVSATSISISSNVFTDGSCVAGSVITFSFSFAGITSFIAGDFLYWDGGSWSTRTLVRTSASATAAGVVKIGSGISVTADGTISAAAGSAYTAGTGIAISGTNVISATNTGGAATGGVFRGAFVASAAYALYDCILIPAGQTNAGLFAYATAAFTATATYDPTKWQLDPGQSTTDYTAAEKSKLASLSAGGATAMALLQVAFNGTQALGNGAFQKIAFNQAPSIDSAGGWQADGTYTVAVGQAGIYECILSVRHPDSAPQGQGYGLGLDVTLQDSPRFSWRATQQFAAGQNARYGGTSQPVLYNLAEGANLKAFWLSDSATTIQTVNLIIKRIR